MTATPLRANQYLVLDADDTLWENNIYFEQAFEDFVRFLDHEHLTSGEIQVILDELESANIETHGYGARAFARCLRDTFLHISGLPESHPDAEIAEKLGLRILNQQMEIREGVVETITALRPLHQLFVLTKGHEEEQRSKVERSGIGELFNAVMISPEKNEDTYRSIVESWSLDPSATWMIGNSPRSDINPALRAGLNAVFIPHPRTWHLEVEEVATSSSDQGQLVQLGAFAELTSLFATETPE